MTFEQYASLPLVEREMLLDSLDAFIERHNAEAGALAGLPRKGERL
jgi:hypothetical protein